eukprot:1013710-Pyramimonas_sp.AAC.1
MAAARRAACAIRCLAIRLLRARPADTSAPRSAAVDPAAAVAPCPLKPLTMRFVSLLEVVTTTVLGLIVRPTSIMAVPMKAPEETSVLSTLPPAPSVLMIASSTNVRIMMESWYRGWAASNSGPSMALASTPPCGDPATTLFPTVVALLSHCPSRR